MPMRLWRQSFTVLSDIPGYEDAMRAHLSKVLRPDTEVVFHGQAPGTYPSDYPGDDIGYGYTFWIHGNQRVAARHAAEAGKFDAFAMCTLPNPMLREVRSLVDIPVIGMGETCCHLATMFGLCSADVLPAYTNPGPVIEQFQEAARRVIREPAPTSSSPARCR